MDARVVENRQVGTSVPRLESSEKVTGEAQYVHNIRLPGMLYGKIFRSRIAHGRIRSIDTSAARAMVGVYAVVTIEDVLRIMPDPYYGPAFHDQPVLAYGKVHYIGEPVAVVLAFDPHIAQEAAALIQAEYDELPAVFDEVEAMTSAVIVHDELRPAGTFPDLKHLKGRKDTNLALDFKLRYGDVETGFAQADRIIEHRFRVQPVMHTPLEPMVSIGEPIGDSLTLYSSTQMPSFVRTEVARLLGWQQSRVRVKSGLLGGGFGAKVYIKLEALVAALALLVQRPVKVSLTMEEQFYTITNHAATLRIRSGVTHGGRITARECEIWWNGGAYADIGPRITQKSGFTAAGPYDIENVRIDSYQIYTNLPPAGAMRGFGCPQLAWAYDSHTDLIARELGIDPLAFRRQNILREGRAQATGTIMHDAAIDEVLVRLGDRMGWDQPFERGTGKIRRGRGIAVGFKAAISPTTSVAMIVISADGSCTLHCNTIDMGQGSDTAMAQVAAETLDIPIDWIKVVRGDTDVNPYDMGTLGSRSTFHMGHAVIAAATDARQKLNALALETGLQIDRDSAAIKSVFLKKYGMLAGNVVGVGTYTAPYAPVNPENGQSSNITPFWMSGGNGAEVEVDTETGHVRVTRLVNVADAGTAINPHIVDTQLSGASIMALGGTMSESMEYRDGELTNGAFAYYKIPGMHDIPASVENEIVASAQKSGPFGAKGVGESASFGVSPAIANAIHDAIGLRLTTLPLTPEAVYRGMRILQGIPLEDE
jgi:CO/xanthine dehydrogenase Mo-binding subunit